MEPEKYTIQPILSNPAKSAATSATGSVEIAGQSPFPRGVAGPFHSTTRNKKSDLEIWRNFKCGDKAAFIFIYQKFFGILYSYGHQLTKDEELIKDCIHDVFAEINQAGQRLSDTNNIKFYLLKSFRNRFCTIRKKPGKILLDKHLMDGYQFEFTLSAEQKMIDSQINQEKLHKLNQAIQQLPRRQREVIYYLFMKN